jgi:hypothetical protein
MIITRLEQERVLAKNRLDRTLRRVVSPYDLAAVQERKTVNEIEGLLARIDGVFVDAVDRFPTMFDFSGGQDELGSASESGDRRKSLADERLRNADDPRAPQRDQQETQDQQAQSQNGMKANPQNQSQGQQQKPNQSQQPNKGQNVNQNPPPVVGEVKRIDPTNSLLELTIGADDGLVVGHQLYIFRVKPRSEYICKVVVVTIDPDQSVAKVVGTTFQGKRIKEGDIVSSTIKPQF